MDKPDSCQAKTDHHIPCDPHRFQLNIVPGDFPLSHSRYLPDRIRPTRPGRRVHLQQILNCLPMDSVWLSMSFIKDFVCIHSLSRTGVCLGSMSVICRTCRSSRSCAHLSPLLFRTATTLNHNLWCVHLKYSESSLDFVDTSSARLLRDR
jgi:hypothetical protein